MLRQCSLLLVEDDLAVCEAITKVLQAEDYEVSNAASCSDAIRRFNEKRIDLVLLDLSLGAEQGWDIFHAFKKRQPDLPIIVISARAEQLAHSSAICASAVLEKPFDVPLLLTLLKQASQAPDACSKSSLLLNTFAATPLEQEPVHTLPTP